LSLKVEGKDSPAGGKQNSNIRIGFDVSLREPPKEKSFAGLQSEAATPKASGYTILDGGLKKLVCYLFSRSDHNQNNVRNARPVSDRNFQERNYHQKPSESRSIVGQQSSTDCNIQIVEQNPGDQKAPL